MSRPGAWRRVATNFMKYLKRDWTEKDAAGHKYYELSGTRHNVTRGFDPSTSNPGAAPSVEWQAWLRGTRRFPPNDQELLFNRARQQAQLAQNVRTEKIAPQVGSTGPPAGGAPDGPKVYPTYKDYESTPGYMPEKEPKK